MATYNRPNVVIDVPDHMSIEDAVRSTVKRGPRTPLPTGPVPLPDSAATDDDPVVAAMRAQDLMLLDSFNIVPGAPASTRAMPAPSRLTVEVDDNEDVAILLEQDGVYSWRYGEAAETVPVPVTRRSPVRSRPRRRVAFDLSVTPSPTSADRRKRGPAADFIIGKVRTYVFRFVARIAVKSAIEFQERKKRTGLVHINADDPTSWSPIERLDELTLPSDRMAKILLFVHGTFSSTVGSFGALGVSEWGRAFLRHAQANYDVVIGYDHRTLSRDPLQNAEDMLGRLEQTNAPGLLIDAVAYSRGALVLRSMIEYLLPSAAIRARVRRAVFVGGTNEGTKLATRDNWHRLVDLSTNLVSVGCRVLSLFAPATLATTIVRESIDTLGALVKCLTSEVLSEDAVPGLAAMVPDGRFVTDINKTQPAQPTAAESLYFVISSDFDVQGIRDGTPVSEFPVGLARWAADVVSDAVMHETNDLVVNTRSMAAIDSSAGNFVKDQLHFGRNSYVYHTIYFTREEVVRALTRWFQLEGATSSAVHFASPASVDDRIVVVEATEPLDVALNAINACGANYVVVQRYIDSGDLLRYAFRSEDLIDAEQTLDPTAKSIPLELAIQNTSLALHESTRTPETSAPVFPVHASPGNASQRLIYIADNVPRGVVESGASIASNSELAKRSKRNTRVTRKPGRQDNLRTITAPSTAQWEMPESFSRSGSQRTSEGSSLAETGDSVFLAVDMPESIVIDQSVPLNVVVCHDSIEVVVRPTRRTAQAKVALDRPAVVQVIAKQNVLVEGDDRAAIDLTLPRTELEFFVKGIAPGPAEIWVLLLQGPVACINIKLLPKVLTASEPTSNGRAVAAADGELLQTGNCKYPLLQIFEWQAGSAFKYHFVLQISPAEFISGYSDEIKYPRDKYVENIYKQIETRWTSTAGDLKDFQEELRQIGGILLDELIPPSVHNVLWKVRDTLKSIQVVAEEPFIPWELVHLKPPRDDNGKPAPLPDGSQFLAQKGLVRWLHNRGAAPQHLTIEKGRSFYVVPEYPHPEFQLPAAQAEIPFLETAFGAEEVAPELGAIRDLLRTPGKIQHFHFSGHGQADARTAVNAQLLLRGTIQNGNWIPSYLQADTVAAYARLEGATGAKALVVLNACQIGRAGWRLSSIGGFAESFLRAGAGIFVGTLWSVGDSSARTFSEAFYKSLLEGHTLAEATTTGREAARQGNDATWPAYVVYGYPCAKVTVLS